MPMKKYGMLKAWAIFAVALLTACATPTVQLSLKTANPSTPVKRIDVVFASNSAKIVGAEIIEVMPKVFAKYGLSSEVKSLSSAEIPLNLSQYWQMFETTPREGVILLLTPEKQTRSCYGGNCAEEIRFQSILVEAKTGKKIWTGWANVPYSSNRITARLASYSEKFSETIISSLQQDAVLSK